MLQRKSQARNNSIRYAFYWWFLNFETIWDGTCNTNQILILSVKSEDKIRTNPTPDVIRSSTEALFSTEGHKVSIHEVAKELPSGRSDVNILASLLSHSMNNFNSCASMLLIILRKTQIFYSCLKPSLSKQFNVLQDLQNDNLLCLKVHQQVSISYSHLSTAELVGMLLANPLGIFFLK